MNFNEKLIKYAQIIGSVGVNVQKGQTVVIRTDIEAKEFVNILTRELYKLGAKTVKVIWSDEETTKTMYEYESIESITEVREYEKQMYNTFIDQGASFISLIGGDPKAFENVDKEKLKASAINKKQTLSYFYKSIMKNDNSWLVVGYANKKWAKAIFPDLEENEATQKLWDLIFYTVRISENSVNDWESHIKLLDDKADKLNDLKIDKLIYTNKKGTNLEIGLPKGYIFQSASSYNKKGDRFVANIPTEEVYTMPHRDRINGIVYSTKPLNYNGNIIDEFFLKFENGYVVDFGAKQGYDTLKTILSMDKGAKSLGEVAIVPHDSPISNTNILFYETLYDENASCHLALGEAYPVCIENGENMTQEELDLKGVNTSMVHIDFMIGDETLDIVAITENGEKVQIFRNGNWE